MIQKYLNILWNSLHLNIFYIQIDSFDSIGTIIITLSYMWVKKTIEQDLNNLRKEATRR